MSAGDTKVFGEALSRGEKSSSRRETHHPSIEENRKRRYYDIDESPPYRSHRRREEDRARGYYDDRASSPERIVTSSGSTSGFSSCRSKRRYGDGDDSSARGAGELSSKYYYRVENSYGGEVKHDARRVRRAGDGDHVPPSSQTSSLRRLHDLEKGFGGFKSSTSLREIWGCSHPPLPPEEILPPLPKDVCPPPVVSGYASEGMEASPATGIDHEKGQYKCYVCDIWTNTEEILNVHLGGKTHVKKLMQAGYNAFLPPKPLGTIPSQGKTKAERQKVGDRGKVSDDKGSLSCEICHLHFTSRVACETHLQGKKHSRQVKVAEAVKARSVDVSCKACNFIATSSVHLEAHLRGKNHRKKVEALIQSGVSEKDVVADVNFIKRESGWDDDDDDYDDDDYYYYDDGDRRERREAFKFSGLYGYKSGDEFVFNCREHDQVIVRFVENVPCHITEHAKEHCGLGELESLVRKSEPKREREGRVKREHPVGSMNGGNEFGFVKKENQF